jgi:hypothetical protein
LASHFPQELASEALHVIRAFEVESYRTLVLAAFAHLLSRKQLRDILAMSPDTRETSEVSLFERLGSLPLEDMRKELRKKFRPHEPTVLHLLHQAVAAASRFTDNDDRAGSLAALADELERLQRHCNSDSDLALLALLPPEMLPGALQVAWHIKNEGDRCKVLAWLAIPLASLPTSTLRSLLLPMLRELARGTRSVSLAHLRALSPVVAALAGSDASTQFREIARGITDVGRWWP